MSEEGTAQRVAAPVKAAGPSHWLSMLHGWRAGLSWPRVAWSSLAELGLISAWAAWVGRSYLNLNPTAWPWGNEFPMGIQSHYAWALLKRCGSCALWNGLVNGGAPAFVDLHGAVLHPLVIASTLLWGPINGAKITLVGSLAMAGLAQWWLARVLRLGRAARLWSAGLAVVGGHLAGRMDAGLVALVLSTAATSLVIPPGLQLALTGSRRAVVGLAVALALALVAGQGYLQLGLLLGVAPAFSLFLFDERLRLRPIWRDFALAGVLALLLAGVFLVPLAHFWPNFAKDVDPQFASAQSPEYVPLNLVIGDPEFYRGTALHKIAYPYLYMSYIGWLPVLLALVGLRLVPRSGRLVVAFLLLAAALVWLTSSPVAWHFWARLLPSLAAGVRYPSLIAGLAVAPVLGLAAWGLDQLLGLPWPELALTAPGGESSLLRLKLWWLILPVPLAWSIVSAYRFGEPYLRTVTLPDVHPVIEALRTATAEWVLPPFGEHFWVPLAFDDGLKTTMTVRPWHWKDRQPPQPRRQAARQEIDALGAVPLRQVEGLSIVEYPGNEYAVLDTGVRRIPYRATATGGFIEVDGEAEVAGTLIVQENQWSGWQATCDGRPLPLRPGPWLSVAAPAGRHRFTFRYRPWDVPVGLAATALGMGLATWLWFRRPPP